MLSQSATVAAALLSDSAVKAIVSTRIYQEEPPAAVVFPCLVFSEQIANAVSADNVMSDARHTFNIESYVKGSAWALSAAVTTAMESIGYVCRFANSAGTVADGSIHQISLQFISMKEV